MLSVTLKPIVTELPLEDATTDLGDERSAPADSTTDTRNRDGPPLVLGKKDGEEPREGEELRDGGVIGEEDTEESAERNDASDTRHTTKRFRDGLGIGLATGEGIGLGAGERKRPPLVRFGSSMRVAGSSAANITDRDGLGSV